MIPKVSNDPNYWQKCAEEAWSASEQPPSFPPSAEQRLRQSGLAVSRLDES
jgi:hypothetical protein